VQNLSLQMDSDPTEHVTVVRDNGVLLDSELLMMHHVFNTDAASQLRRLRQIRRRVGQDVTTCLLSGSGPHNFPAGRFWQIYSSRQLSCCNEFKTLQHV
jgi:hypothetical protein